MTIIKLRAETSKTWFEIHSGDALDADQIREIIEYLKVYEMALDKRADKSRRRSSRAVVS